MLRNTGRARRRGWITSSSSAAELSISDSAAGPRRYIFKWRGEDEPENPEGAEVITVGWGKGPDGKEIIPGGCGKVAEPKVLEHEPDPKAKDEG